MAVWEQLLRCVEEKGFTLMRNDIPRTQVYGRNSADGLYVIVLMQEPAEVGLSVVSYGEVMDKTVETLYWKSGRMPAALGIICGRAPENYKDWCVNGKTWLVENDTGRLIIYENQIASFLNLEQELETRLAPGFRTHREGRSGEQRNSVFSYASFPVVTVGIVVINVLVFLIFEGFASPERTAVTIGRFAQYWPSIVEDGEYYRLVTSMFLHFGSAHLVNNMLILFVIGSRLEDLTGKVRFTLIYFISGILAGLTSMGYNMLQHRSVMAAGASGAVFGLVGAMIWVVIANKGRVRGLGTRQMLFFAALSLYGGFASQQTDNAAHVGGLIAGFLLAVLIYRKENRQNKPAPERG